MSTDVSPFFHIFFIVECFLGIKKRKSRLNYLRCNIERQIPEPNFIGFLHDQSNSERV